MLWHIHIRLSVNFNITFHPSQCTLYYQVRLAISFASIRWHLMYTGEPGISVWMKAPLTSILGNYKIITCSSCKACKIECFAMVGYEQFRCTSGSCSFPLATILDFILACSPFAKNFLTVNRYQFKGLHDTHIKRL